MKPIGYWLNRTDRALTAAMDTVLAEFGLTRIAWQVLTTVRENGEVTETQVVSSLAVNAAPATLAAAVETVHAGGWVSRPAPGRLSLTDGGARRLADVATRVETFRDRSMTGITVDDYRTAVRVLERMTHNVEPVDTGPR
jgi:DNA-binding MarR family transcriptional regulator